MNQGILRNLKYQGRVMGQMVGYMLLTTAALLLWQSLSTPLAYLAENLAASSFMFLVFSAFIWSAGSFLAMHTSFLPYALSFGTTRRASFLASQLVKMGYALGTVLIGLLANGIIGMLTADVGLPFNGSIMILLFCLVVLFASMMEIVGLVMKRFGKWGMIIYVVICMVLGGGVGIVFSMAGGDELGDLSRQVIELASSGSLTPIIAGAMLLLSAVSTGICWRLYRKIEV